MGYMNGDFGLDSWCPSGTIAYHAVTNKATSFVFALAFRSHR